MANATLRGKRSYAVGFTASSVQVLPALYSWSVGSGVKAFRCLTFMFSLCPNVLGACYK
jgi:hypothetical protein